MEEIKNALLDFFRLEAEAQTKDSIPDLEDYNNTVREMYSYTTRLLFEGLGVVLYDELQDEDYYEMYKDFPPNKPAILFKISHYKHAKYKDVWIGYSSINNPKAKTLSAAYFVIKEEGKYLIAKRYSYTEFYTDGAKMQWEPGQGYSDLTFESLGELITIERYLEPDDYDNSLELYNDNV